MSGRQGQRRPGMWSIQQDWRTFTNSVIICHLWKYSAARIGESGEFGDVIASLTIEELPDDGGAGLESEAGDQQPVGTAAGK